MKSVLSVLGAAGLALCGIALAQPAPSAQAVPQAPSAPQREHVSQWHGERVSDPWFWLREKDSPPVLAYLNAENAYTQAVTQGLAPFAASLYGEMLGRIQQTDLDVPVRQGGWYYYTRTVEGQQYPIHARRKATARQTYDEQAPEEVLLDLNQMGRGKAFISVDQTAVSDDGQWLLYTLDETGYRQYALYRKSLVTGRIDGPLAERVTSVQWAADNATVFFTTEDAVSKRSDTLWRLAAGSQPERLFEERDALFRIELQRTKDLRYLVLMSGATDTWESRLLDAKRPGGQFHTVLPREKGHKYTVDHRDGLLYIRTNREAKNFRVVTAPVADPQRWTPLVAHQPDVLISDLDVFRGHLVVSEIRQGLRRFRIHDFKRGGWRELPFAEAAYAATATGTPDFDSHTFRYRYESMVEPRSVHDFDMDQDRDTRLKQEAVLGGYDPAHYATERLWITARDGVRVPVSIVYRKGRARDGKLPLWLTGYGAYGSGVSVRFDSKRISLLDRGFAVAVAHVRGGNEMGEAWHDDGMLMHKKNSFTDFIDVAEHLVRTQWTAPDRLVIEGGSAGGLLMGAVVNMRPDLFKAAHLAVPFVDVLNTMMDASLPLTVGEYLEWGNPNEKPAFDYIRSYSPYDNLRPQAYPALLVTTSYNDSQVGYWEPAKYVAKLRTLKTGSQPLLLKTKMEPAGHGGASGRYDALKDRAFELAWMMEQVGITR